MIHTKRCQGPLGELNPSQTLRIRHISYAGQLVDHGQPLQRLHCKIQLGRMDDRLQAVHSSTGMGMGTSHWPANCSRLMIGPW